MKTAFANPQLDQRRSLSLRNDESVQNKRGVLAWLARSRMLKISFIDKN